MAGACVNLVLSPIAGIKRFFKGKSKSAVPNAAKHYVLCPKCNGWKVCPTLGFYGNMTTIIYKDCDFCGGEGFTLTKIS